MAVSSRNNICPQDCSAATSLHGGGRRERGYSEGEGSVRKRGGKQILSHEDEKWQRMIVVRGTRSSSADGRAALLPQTNCTTNNIITLSPCLIYSQHQRIDFSSPPQYTWREYWLNLLWTVINNVSAKIKPLTTQPGLRAFCIILYVNARHSICYVLYVTY